MNMKMFMRAAVLVLLGLSLSGCSWILTPPHGPLSSPQYNRPLDDIEGGSGVPGGTGT